MTLRIAMLIPKLEPGENGVFIGGHVNALKQACIALKGEHSITVFSCIPTAKRELFERFTPDWAQFEVMVNDRAAQSYGYGLEYFMRMLSGPMRRALQNYDIVHAHSGFVHYMAVSAALKALVRSAVVHSIYCPLEAADWRSKLFVRAGNSLDAVVAMSENVKKSLLSAGATGDRLTVIPPAIDTDTFTPSRRRRGIDGRKTVLFVGNAKPSKGFDVLCEAFARVSRERPDVRMVATFELKHSGFDDTLTRCKGILSAAGCFDRVEFLGIIPDMASVMADSDVIVCPYRDTQGPSDYPIAVMEAMAAGVPVVGTTVGALPELVENSGAGVLVNRESPEEIASAITRLLGDDGLRGAMSQRARKVIVDRYSRELCRKRHNDLYHRILE